MEAVIEQVTVLASRVSAPPAPCYEPAMSSLKSVIIFALVAYCGVVGLMYFAQRALMYFPDTARTVPADAGLANAEEITLHSADGTKVLAWYVAPKGDKPLVVYFHGNGGSLRHRVPRFA